MPSPIKRPQDLDIVIFRENTEDVYAGIEWKKGSQEAKKIIDFVSRELGFEISKDSGIGIKPISVFATQRLVRRAIQYAIDHKCPSVTLMHKGNIMKFTEGAFKEWGYAIAKKEFHQTKKPRVDLYLGLTPGWVRWTEEKNALGNRSKECAKQSLRCRRSRCQLSLPPRGC